MFKAPGIDGCEDSLAGWGRIPLTVHLLPAGWGYTFLYFIINEGERLGYRETWPFGVKDGGILKLICYQVRGAWVPRKLAFAEG